MRFSARYKTYSQWLGARRRTSSYAKRIIARHKVAPRRSLSQLRKTKLSIISSQSWSSLSPSQRYSRKLSLEVVRRMRKGESFSQASKSVGISSKKIQQHLGGVIYKKKGRWIVKSIDSLSRQMNIYSRGRRISITVTNSKDAKLIGKYFADVKKYLYTGDQTVLRKYEDVVIVDEDGVGHSLETNPQTIRDIEEGKENPEFFEVYADE